MNWNTTRKWRTFKLNGRDVQPHGWTTWGDESAPWYFLIEYVGGEYVLRMTNDSRTDWENDTWTKARASTGVLDTAMKRVHRTIEAHGIPAVIIDTFYEATKPKEKVWDGKVRRWKYRWEYRVDKWTLVFDDDTYFDCDAIGEAIDTSAAREVWDRDYKRLPIVRRIPDAMRVEVCWPRKGYWESGTEEHCREATKPFDINSESGACARVFGLT